MDKVWTLWDLLIEDYTGLDLISSIKSLFPHFNVNSKSMVPEKQHKLDHVAVEMDVTTSVTAVQDDVASSTVACQPTFNTIFSIRKIKHQYIVRWAAIG